MKAESVLKFSSGLGGCQNKIHYTKLILLCTIQLNWKHIQGLLIKVANKINFRALITYFYLTTRRVVREFNT